MRKPSIIAFVILISISLGGCGNPTSLPTPGPAQTDFPIGKFEGGIGDQYQFFEDGTYEQYIAPTWDKVNSSGTYTISGDQIVFTETDGEFCSWDEGGIYTWDFDGDLLNFTPIKDLCAERKNVIGKYLFEQISSD